MRLLQMGSEKAVYGNCVGVRFSIFHLPKNCVAEVCSLWPSVWWTQEKKELVGAENLLG